MGKRIRRFWEGIAMPKPDGRIALPCLLVSIGLLGLLFVAACGSGDGGGEVGATTAAVASTPEPAPAPAPAPAPEPAAAPEPTPAVEPEPTPAVDPVPTSEPVAAAEPEPEARAQAEPEPVVVPLQIGSLVPETGPLAPLAGPSREAIALAVEDINAAGGDVTLTTADSATNPEIAIEAVSRLLAEGADVIVGPAASSITQAVIQTLYDQRVPQCSPSAQSPAFSTQENAAYFFRTVPSVQGVAPIIANVVAGDGATRVALVGRADEYGIAITGLVAMLLGEIGAESETFLYDPAAVAFDAEVAAVAGYGPDAIVNVGFFFDGANIIRDLIEAGFGPEMQYGSDALFHPYLWQLIDPNDPTVLDGMQIIGVAGREEFNERLTEITDGNVNFAGQSYDCVVLLALAAQIATGVYGDAIIEAIGGITEGGTECRSYAECAALIADGQDIDYVGVSGPLNLNAVGDPTVGSYGVFRFENGTLSITRSIEVDLTQFS